ncbi:acyltransferase [Paenibacillus endoradicis]|uniref:acyltransferase n=1 Tax=Paenibacillus endoradicis TaxID=2972487 RepID=UPI002159A6E6|nr:acyltransferase [Paenibacillus endoradicis]MCR8657346.1 acyltransferase [Paenibacillus endoradicis]
MSQLLSSKRESIPQLSIVRAIAILGVLSIHSTSVAVSTGMIDSSWFFLYNFANIFLKFGTTTFIFLSSFVLFYNYYNRPLTGKLVTSFYKKRLMYIIVPYVSFSLFYFILKLYLYPESYPLIFGNGFSFGEMMSALGDRLMHGTAHTHLYFVYISIQFYLLFPLFLWFFKKYPKLTHWLLLIGIVVQWGFFLVNKYGLETPVTARGSWSLSYFTYYFLGAYLGIYYDKWKQWINIAKENVTKKRVIGWIVFSLIWLSSGLLHVYMWYETRLKLDSYSSTLFDLVWNIHTLTTAIILMQLAFIIYRKAATPVKNLLMRLGEVSFGVYLFHPFLLLIYRAYPPQSGASIVHHAWYVGGFLFALIGSWIVVELVVRYIPQSWLIFGSIKKRKPSQPQVKDKAPNVQM